MGSAPPSLWQTLLSVLAAFFGVQTRANRERDFTHGRASHFIVMGLLATLAFIGLLVWLVRTVLRLAGADG
ncbi:MAG TPA: DUF2970 domain-containing protein [Nevskiaceae bacterium]|nr:DUF2970 domain-containing protein [Nevskiaceae bacterium]